MAEVKKCPYCGEEILGTAVKCKHCGEWLEKEQLNIYYTIVQAIFMVGVAWVLFHFGSWHFVLGNAEQFIQPPYYTSKIINTIEVVDIDKFQDVELISLILKRNAVLVRICDGYYGFANDARFFDSPVFQWIMLFVSIGGILAFFHLLKVLISGNDDLKK